jgi:lauroyl/myristoyl acyltransferase
VVIGESPLKDTYRRVVWGPWRRALEAAPPGWDYRASRRLGRLAGRLSGQKRADVVANLRRAFPDRSDLDAVAVEAFGAHFENQYASFAFGRLDAQNWGSWLRFEGLEHLDRAAAAEAGVVLMHPHMGPAQLPLAALAAMGRPVHQVGGGGVAVEKSAVGEWASAERARLEARMKATLHDGTGFLRGLVRAAAAGGIVLTACDGTGGGKELGRRLERRVLGQAMGVPVAPFWLARQAGARLHTLYTSRDPLEPRRHVSVIGPEVPVARGGPMEATLEAGADFTAAWLTLVLRRHPEAWCFWDEFRPGGLLLR